MEGGDQDQETAADLARLTDSCSEQPDPAAVRAGMLPYLGDIDRYMRSLETSRRPRDDYIWTTQRDIRPDMRAILVDWLAEVALEFSLPSDALHLAVSYVDRFLSATVISQDMLQLLGVTALLVAAKYENYIFLHDVERYSYITDNTYTREQVVKMEADILKFLNFEMGSPTARTFLQRYITACRGGSGAKAKKLEFLCSYLADLSLLDYDCIRFNPSVVAAACLFVARFTISPTTRPWNLTLQRNTDYKVSDLKHCILIIHRLQLNGTYPGLKEEAIKDKYNDCELEHVSAMDPPRKIPAHFLEDIEPGKAEVRSQHVLQSLQKLKILSFLVESGLFRHWGFGALSVGFLLICASRVVAESVSMS